MFDQEFHSSLRYWLGIPLFGDVHQQPAYEAKANTMGDHQVGCRGNGNCISCHNNIRDVLFSVAVTAALAPSRRPLGLSPTLAHTQQMSYFQTGAMVIMQLLTYKLLPLCNIWGSINSGPCSKYMHSQLTFLFAVQLVSTNGGGGAGG